MSTLSTPSPQPPSSNATTPSSTEVEITKPSEISESKPITSPVNYTRTKRERFRNLFSSTISSLQRIHIRNPNQHLSSPQRSNSNTRNPLASLPTFVLLCIADYLQNHQIALLSLTCTSILVKFGTDHITSLTSSRDLSESFECFTQRRHFLILLSEDDIQSRYCDHCYKIHKYIPPHLKKSLQKVADRFGRLECEDAYHNWELWKGNECQYFFRDGLLSFTSCQALMKAYRHSLRSRDGAKFQPALEDVKTQLGGLSYIRFEPKIFARRVIFQRAGRIRDGRLLVQTQWRMFIPFGADDAEINKRTKDVKACGHLYRSTAGTTFFDRVVTGRAEEGLEWLDPEGEDSSNDDDEEEEDEEDIFNPVSPSSLSPISPSDQEPIPFALRSPSPCSFLSSSPSSNQPSQPAPITHSCSLCPTDYTINFRAGRAPQNPSRFGKHRFTTTREKKEGERGIYLVLRVFTDLGECRDFWEEQWNCGPHTRGRGMCMSRRGWPVLEPREGGRGGNVGALEAWDKGGEVGIF